MIKAAYDGYLEIIRKELKTALANAMIWFVILCYANIQSFTKRPRKHNQISQVSGIYITEWVSSWENFIFCWVEEKSFDSVQPDGKLTNKVYK